MKKGISLIVLVITIIVMIIIAGAIIISLNSTNIIDKANTAVDESNEAELKSLVALTYMNQYVAYWESNEAGTAATKPDAKTVAADADVAAMLTEMNKNTTNLVYAVEDAKDADGKTTGGVVVTVTAKQ